MINNLVNEVKKEAVKRYGDDFVVLKRNYLKGDCILLGFKTDAVKPCIYLDVFVKRLHEGVPMANVVLEIFDVYNSVDHSKLNKTLSIDKILDKARQNTYLQVISSKHEMDLIEKDVVYEKYLDLLVCYRIVVTKDEYTGETGTTLVTNRLLEATKMTKEYIHNVAVENSKKDNWSIITMEDRLSEILLKDDDINAEPTMYIIGEKAIFGGACIYTKSGIKELAKKLNKNILILPSSIHELILLPCDDDICKNEFGIKKMVNEINNEYVSDDEFLSNNIYLYSLEKDEITII